MNTWHRFGLFSSVAAALFACFWLAEHSRAVAGQPLESAAARMAPEAALVSVNPPSQTVIAGEPFTVTIKISGLASPLSAFQFDLGYDPARLRLVSTSPGSFLSSTGRMLICPEPAHPTTSTLRLACTGAGEAPGPVGSGTLVALTFTALEVGSSPLSLSALQLPGGGIPPASISASAQGGQVTIIAAPQVHKIYLPVIRKGN